MLYSLYYINICIVRTPDHDQILIMVRSPDHSDKHYEFEMVRVASVLHLGICFDSTVS